MSERDETPDHPYQASRTATADGRRFAPAVARNREPLLAALRGILPSHGVVLEIGSGTGEHAIFLASHLRDLIFQPSDPDPVARESIAAWIAESGATNVLPPLALTTETATTLDLGDRASEVRAVMSANVIHISPWTTCLGLLRLASELLPMGSPLCLYGPFKRGGSHTAASNESFDEMLRSRDPAWGVRDLEEVERAAGEVDLSLDQVIEMPANNWVVVFRK